MKHPLVLDPHGRKRGGETPLVCTPLVGRTRERLLREAAAILPKAPDLLEWRVDHYGAVGDTAAVIETLAEESRAALVILPAQANLAGLLRSGAFTSAAPLSQAPADVLYLLGSGMPENLAAGTYTIFQNIYYPAQGAADLLLPAAAFTEMSGTLTSQAGKENWLYPAVPTPGAARPAWQALSQLARAMGAEGFDFETLDAVRAEMAARPAFDPQTVAGSIAPTILNVPGEHWNGVPIYMGFVMAQAVEGLQCLYPDKSKSPDRQTAAGGNAETEPTQMEGLHV